MLIQVFYNWLQFMTLVCALIFGMFARLDSGRGSLKKPLIAIDMTHAQVDSQMGRKPNLVYIPNLHEENQQLLTVERWVFEEFMVDVTFGKDHKVSKIDNIPSNLSNTGFTLRHFEHLLDRWLLKRTKT
jgi:hypothetical protein